MFTPVLSLLLCIAVALVAAAPAGSPTYTPSSVATSATASATVSPASDDPNTPLWGPYSNIRPEAVRGKLGATILGPENVPIELQNPDLLAPPSTDSGQLPSAKWPFSLSHTRLQTGGWARQQTENQMPISTAFAGVNMRLEAGAIRELHWHTVAEWAYVIAGDMQITAVDTDGRNYLSTLHPGDLWYFPPGIPHYLQALNTTADGAEFLLVFPSGTFSEDNTFLLTDWLAHVPKEVIAKNFGTDVSAFDNIPSKELYIFPAEPLPADEKAPASPQGEVPNPYSFAASTMPAKQFPGGTVKIVDSTVFKAATQVAFAEVTIEPGHMRELHWHPTNPEWNIFLKGQGRITLFAASSTANTFNYQAGDVGYIPASYGHYIENTGNSTLKYLELLNTPVYNDMSLSQWLALTPSAIVKDHLRISDETFAHFQKTKQYVV